jgi:hypothetical protein
MGKLNLEKISVANYGALSSKNANTIYWLEDGTVYTGDKLYGGKVSFTTSDPESPELNTLYINPNTKKIKIYNGTELVVINNGYTEDISTALAEGGDDSLTPTARALDNYLKEKYGDRDLVVTAGKYVEDTDNDKHELWLSIAEKGAEDPYANEDEVIKIPVGSLVDIYTSKDTDSTTTSIVDNEISVNVKVSATEGNHLTIKDDGLYVSVTDTDISGKADKVGANHENEVALYDTTGNLKAEGISVGGATLSESADSNTLATEEAVKTYADSLINWINW